MTLQGRQIFLGSVLVSVLVFFGGAHEVRAAIRVNHLGITGKTYIGKSVNPPNLANGLIGWWTFDGKDMKPAVMDRSGNGRNGILVNYTSTTTVSGLLGQAVSFDTGSQNVIQVPSFVPSSYGSLPFTISLWFKATSTTGMTLLNVGRAGACVTSPRIYLSAGKIAAVQSDGACGGTTVTSQTSITVGKWYHLVLIVRSGSQELYLNGTIDATSTGTSALPGDQGCLQFGSDGGGNGCQVGSEVFGGAIDDVRIFNRALTASEAGQLNRLGTGSHQATTLTPPNLQSGLVGHWTFDGKDMNPNVRDLSGYGKHGSFAGASTTTVPGKVGQAISLNGTSQYIDLGTSPDMNLSGSISVCAWVNTSSTTNLGVILSMYDSGTGNTLFSMNTTPIGGSGYMFFGQLLLEPIYGVRSSISVALNKWEYWCGTSDTVNTKLYKNGVLDGGTVYADSPSFSVDSINNTGLSVGVGVEYPVSPFYQWRGLLDDVRVYNRALSVAEVLQLYNLGR